LGGTDVVDGSGCPDAPDEEECLPPGLAAWFAIAECVGETLDALRGLPGEAEQAMTFMSYLHGEVRTWLSWELWAALLGPGQYSPDSLLEALLREGVDVRQLARSSPASPPRPGTAPEWRAFTAGDDRG
jgi:hypothetical protein